MTITYRAYSTILDEWFTYTQNFNSINDFRLYAKSMFSGNYEIISTN